MNLNTKKARVFILFPRHPFSESGGWRGMELKRGKNKGAYIYSKAYMFVILKVMDRICYQSVDRQKL
jgi:hypothetical protein